MSKKCIYLPPHVLGHLSDTWTSIIFILVTALVKTSIYNYWIQFYGIGYIQKPPFIFMQAEQNVLHQPWTKYKEWTVCFNTHTYINTVFEKTKNPSFVALAALPHIKIASMSVKTLSQVFIAVQTLPLLLLEMRALTSKQSSL